VSPHKSEREGKARRRSKRPFIRIPIEVRGTDVNGRSFSENTQTVAVNRNGARISLMNSMLPGARITITNLKREDSCAFRVVERTATTYGNQAEWGVECLDPDRNFWGVYFPERTPSAQQDEDIDVMLECTVCRSREMAQLSLNQFRELSDKSAIERHCPKCGKSAAWEFGFAEVLLEESRAKAPPSVAAALYSGTDRRKSKRFVAMLPLRLRKESGKLVSSRTENLSKPGLCFICELEMEAGEVIYLSVGPPENGKREIPARIAWRRPVVGSNRSVYGVRLEAGEND
jgi:Tfp pilus assembly protein PilZ